MSAARCSFHLFLVQWYDQCTIPALRSGRGNEKHRAGSGHATRSTQGQAMAAAGCVEGGRASSPRLSPQLVCGLLERHPLHLVFQAPANCG